MTALDAGSIEGLPSAGVPVKSYPPPEPAPSTIEDVNAVWDIAAPADSGIELDWKWADRLDVGQRLQWSEPKGIDAALRLAWHFASPKDLQAVIAWADTSVYLAASLSIAWIQMPAKDRAWALVWAMSSGYLAQSTTLDWFDGIPRDGSVIDLDWSESLPLAASAAIDLSAGTRFTDSPIRLFWGVGKPLLSSVAPSWPVDPVLPPNWPSLLPDQDTYMIANSINVVRLPDMTPIVCIAADLQASKDSWGWTIDLTLGSQAALNLLDPSPSGPRTVQVTINGFTVIGLMRTYRRSLTFKQKTWTVSGSSLSAQFAAPYATPRTFTNTALTSASQLALNELSGTDWTIDWQVPDWNLDAGQFSYNSLTPMEAITLLAAAAGAVVQTDPSAHTLHIVSKYPLKPSQWSSATPVAVIPPGIMTQLEGDFLEQPAYDYVYVSGGTQGINYEGTLSGTGGTNPMPDSITDPLITQVAVGQERARVELSGTGSQITTTNAMPVIAPIGVPLPLKLVQVQEDANTAYMAQVNSTRVTANRSGPALTVAMALTMERRT